MESTDNNKFCYELTSSETIFVLKECDSEERLSHHINEINIISKILYLKYLIYLISKHFKFK